MIQKKGWLTLYFSQSCQRLTLIMSWQVQICPFSTPPPQNIELELPYHFSFFIHLVIYTTCSKIISWLFKERTDITLVQCKCWNNTHKQATLPVVVCLLLLSLFVLLVLMVFTKSIVFFIETSIQDAVEAKKHLNNSTFTQVQLRTWQSKSPTFFY